MGSFGKEIHSLIKAVDAIRGDAEDMPIQQLQTVLAIALRPGLTMSDLSDAVGMSQASCSRNVAALSRWHRLGKAGVDLVEAIEDPRERRRKIMYLTHKGKVRVKAALEGLTGKPVEFETPSSKEAWKA